MLDAIIRLSLRYRTLVVMLALATLLYGPLGIVLVILGFKVFDWITPRMDIQKELTEKADALVKSNSWKMS